MTDLLLTPVFEEAEEGGYIGYIAELPGTDVQGETLEETLQNLLDAVALILEDNSEDMEEPPSHVRNA